MSGWLIAVTAVIILTAAANLVMPEGRTGKLTRSIFSIVCLLVVLMPLSALKGGGYQLQPFFEEESYDLDGDFLLFLSIQRSEYLEKQTTDYLEKLGYMGAEVKVQMKVEGYDYTVDKVFVNIENLSIKENNQHINIIIEITKLTADFLSLQTERVIVYG